MEYIVIKDTREKKGWDFSSSKGCLEMVERKLDTGDYSLDGYENTLCIERKECVAEFATNVNEDRFARELERMVEIEMAFIILEFTMEDLLKFPRQLPPAVRKRISYNGYYLLKKLIDLQFEYPTVNIIFAGRKGKDYVSSIFKRTLEHYEEEE